VPQKHIAVRYLNVLAENARAVLQLRCDKWQR
jgi:hypothetical protein